MSSLKVIQGSFHQGNEKFGETAGKQCTCCSLFSVAFGLVKSPGHWVSNDLDFIVENGDTIYKTLDKETYLMVSELPKEISFLETNIEVEYLEEKIGLINGNCSVGILFERNMSSNFDGLLFLIKGICISISWTKKSYFLFDSHSKNERGESCPNGFSTLLKFNTRSSLETHIIENYLNSTDENIQFEVHYIKLSKTDDVDLYSNYRLLKKKTVEKESCRKRKSSDLEKEKCRKRNATENAKEKSRQRNATANAKEKCRQRNATENAKTKSHKRKQTMKENAEFTNRVDAFKNAVKEGPYYICVVCNRCLYKKTVKHFDQSSYETEYGYLFTPVESFDHNNYICLTCDRHIVKKQIPCQAVWNKLRLDELPEDIACLNRLEKILISKRILFKKVTIMPKGQQPKIKGAVCNIPVRADAISNCLPRAPDSNGIIFIKLKRKISFRGHVFFESVRPDCIKNALEYLKSFNPFYSNVLIKIDNINKELLSLLDIEAAVEQDEFPIEIDTEENLEDENHLDNERINSDEMTVIPNIYSETESLLNIAPGENRTPESFFNDEFCEEQAFPYLLPKGKFGYKVLRSVQLSPVKYFNQRLLNYTQRFSSNGDYIFFAHYVMQQINLFNQINIATSKVSGTINAGQLKNNFRETVQSFISEDKGFTFMKSVKGTPAYWKHFLHDVLAMVKQLGLPTFFVTLSCADLRWKELILIISRLNKIDTLETELAYFKKCEILNQNPILTARHFQFRVETFFKEIILHKNSPLGKVDYYVIKVEFQFRGSPHIHSFIWVRDPPLLTHDTKDEYILFVDSVVRTDLPDETHEPDLFKLVSQYQVHKHSRSCRKYKNIPCRFNYGRFFTDRTICAEPLNPTLPDVDKVTILSERAMLLKKVKNYIDEFLDPHKPSYVSDISIPKILNFLDTSEEEYYQALSIASGEDFEIHLRRPPNSCFVNNYFALGLEAWEANMDIQPVFNYFKAISYMCSYFSKSETESSVAMKKAAEESENLNFKDRMKKLAIAFLSHRQCSLQEAVYQLMPELWLRKTFPAVTFANTNLPEKRFHICKNEKELSELPEESTDVFKKNNLDRYMERPDKTFKGGKYSILDSFCYAQFLAYYVLETNPTKFEKNDSQPEVLDDDTSCTENTCVYPKSIPLMSSKETMRCRNVKKVLRYYTPNSVTHAEAYAHHLLMLFYPFRRECDLLSQSSNTYLGKLNEPDVMLVVNQNKEKYEPWGDLVDAALMSHTSQPRTDNFAQQENEDLTDEFQEQTESPEDNNIDDNIVDFQVESRNHSSGTTPQSTLNIMADDEINLLIASLNIRQREVFNYINSWARKKIANMSSENSIEIEPLQIFLTGGAGTGKSHLIKTIYASLTKTLNFHSINLNKPKVLLLAPTGVAAVNISGNTIHSALGIPVDCRGLQISKLSDKKRCSLRLQLEELKAIVIDEISMVANKLLLYIHQRLLDIFGYSGNSMKPFAGITIIVVGDLYQLPPVLQRPVFADYYDEMYNIFHLWRVFKMCELTEVMRQRGDNTLIDLLNNIRVGNLTTRDEEILKSRFISKENENYPNEALHIFAENEPARRHNFLMIEKLNQPIVTIQAIDQVPKGVPNHVYDRILNLSQSQTNGLSFQLNIKVGARVMLTSNLDIADKLINGQIGTIIHILVKNSQVETVFVRFDNTKAGQLKKAANPIARQFDAVPIERITTDIKTNAKKEASPIIKRIQFPLTLSWACTVHKVQGLSLSQVVISFDLLKQKSFNYGQMYVALSRVTSLQGLFLTGKFNKAVIKADERTKIEYEYLRENQSLQTELESLDGISVMMCNVRSLKKHISDIKADTRFISSNLILCTETQMTDVDYCDNTNNISIDGFSVLYNNSVHKYSSLAYFINNNIRIVEEFKSNGISIIKSVSENVDFKILLLYRKNDWPTRTFYETLRYHIIANEIDIVAGDFNLKPNEQLNYILEAYDQLVSEPTHIGGSIIDHVYVKSSFRWNYDVTVSIKTVFFSDHEAIRISIKKVMATDNPGSAQNHQLPS